MPSRTLRGAAATTHTLHEIARALGADLVGDGSLVVTSVAHPLLAEGAETLALATDLTAEEALPRTRAVSAVVAAGRAGALAPLSGGIVVSRPRYALAQLLEMFVVPPVIESGVHPTAIVHPSATIGTDVSIGACAVVGPGSRIGDRTRVLSHVTIGANVTVGDDGLIHAGVRIGDRCVLGHRIILHPNAVIGSDGFGFVTPEKGSVESARTTGRVDATNVTLVRVNSIGSVVIDDDVEIGAGTCVDLATLGVTRIGRGTKIDNLVQVGHNAVIGPNCLIIGQAGVAGSVTLGAGVILAGQCAVKDHVTMGDRSILAACSGLMDDVEPGQMVSGIPAIPHRQSLREYAAIRRLPELITQVRKLQEELNELKKSAGKP